MMHPPESSEVDYRSGQTSDDAANLLSLGVVPRR